MKYILIGSDPGLGSSVVRVPGNIWVDLGPGSNPGLVIFCTYRQRFAGLQIQTPTAIYRSESFKWPNTRYFGLKTAIFAQTEYFSKVNV